MIEQDGSIRTLRSTARIGPASGDTSCAENLVRLDGFGRMRDSLIPPGCTTR